MVQLPAELSGTWEIDPIHSTLGFAARHAMVATTRGHFESFKGGATIDVDNPESSSAWVDIDAASLTTNMSQRDDHLRSADFFDVENHPTITFRSTGA
jgi:polyisoprenoid-binding protein YceI